MRHVLQGLAAERRQGGLARWSAENQPQWMARRFSAEAAIEGAAASVRNSQANVTDGRPSMRRSAESATR